MASRPASGHDDESGLDMADSAAENEAKLLAALQPSIPPASDASMDNSTHHFFVDSVPDSHVEVHVDSVIDEDAYDVYNVDARVQKVLRLQTMRSGELYSVRLFSGHIDKLALLDLVHLPGGQQALDDFEFSTAPERSSLEDSDSSNMRRSSRISKRKRASYVDSTGNDLSDASQGSAVKRKRPSRRQPPRAAGPDYDESDSEDIFSKGIHNLRQRISALPELSMHSFQLDATDSEEESESNEDDFVDALTRSAPRRNRKPGQSRRRKKNDYEPFRQFERRSRRRKSMLEIYEDDIPEIELSQSGKPKPVGAKENFVSLDRSDEFRLRHCQYCIVCGDAHEGKDKGPLVFCQGCTNSYHADCLGRRSFREHLVTKVGDGQFVLQCRHCIDAPARKDPNAPLFSKCQGCMEPGSSTKPFRVRKTPKEEQREREEIGGKDPITAVDSAKLNQVRNVMLRCVSCHRAWHINHLPARQESLFEIEDEEERAAKRWEEYAPDFTCTDCNENTLGIGGIIAWRPKHIDRYVLGTDPEKTSDDEKEYLVRWTNRSYFQAKWMPGAWLWSVCHKTMLAAFYKRNDGKVPPIMRTEDAIPEEYLRVDIVFKVHYNNIVTDQIEEVDLARIREVDRALVKYKGLGYEDVVWDQPPDPSQTPERRHDFKTAYGDWVRGNYIRLPSSSTLNANLRRVRALPFEEKVLLKEQPGSLKGGELMSYQLDGLNWLYYQWHRGQNAILADEMGLGKTIQVIGFLSTLREKHHCWPFLVVVPNATCANWRREIRLWAPSLRVVTYFGASKALEMTQKYELFHENNKDLKCHVVVTSYEAAQNPACHKVLRRVHWQVLVVDEGQRLKNDEGILYHSLSMLRTPFKLLLTGTPLQNNQRELFNLLQFLDPMKNARALGEKYEVINKENIMELHSMLRPFFLRRTKAQVLDFLPTMAQIIVPVSMSALQKELYKTILAKNAGLLRSVFGSEKKVAAKGGLRNILMQLRKCLCHPFVYNVEIEERTHEAAVSHQRLVEASSKLQLLELMLPKLQERGHRVLIFSQFLDMLTIMEDFLQDLGLEHMRLDGSMNSLEKQKRIDKFNAVDSNVFAFLLSTRAGGVGINLATADTVIILDPDFNPHQDIQAISRAHRIGQKKKVLVFQLMTRASAEEKIMQIGKKKMALDHALIDAMEAEEENVDDLEAILRFGAEALFKDDDSSDIRYDSVSVDNLLDRSQVEDTKTDQTNSVESQFSFARVWQNESSSIADVIGASDDDTGQVGVWDQILAERARQAEIEAGLKAEKLGRGKRRRKNVDYQSDARHGDGDAAFGDEAEKPGKEGEGGNKILDTDFQVQAESEESSEGSADEDPIDLDDPAFTKKPRRGQVLEPAPSALKRVPMPALPAPGQTPPPSAIFCQACGTQHVQGSCPLKLVGYELCGLCGLAHFGHHRSCPHLNSETQVRLMLQALDKSPEPKEHVDRARKMLRTLKTNLISQKKAKAKKLQMQAQETSMGKSMQGAVSTPDHALGRPPGSLQDLRGPQQGPFPRIVQSTGAAEASSITRGSLLSFSAANFASSHASVKAAR